jgi:alkylation response protein AidB-like acyl-CoA dehydrogenase
MDAEFSDEQELLRATVRRLLAERAPLSWVRSVYDDPDDRSPLWPDLAALGVLGLLAPDAPGGMVDAGVVLEEMGRAVHPGPYLWSAVGAVSLADEDLLAPLVDGVLTATVAFDEAHVPSPMVDVILLVEGDTVVAVRGAAVTPTPTVDGSRRFGTIAGGERRVVATGAADAIARTRDLLTIGLVVDAVGAATRALELAVEYAKTRVQFDKPIGAFQAVQHLCADMLRDVELARAGAYYALWAADAQPAEERHRAATMAKAFASDGLCRVGANAIQVFGGVGFTWEHDVHLFYKRLLTNQHVLGGTIDHLEELATMALRHT